jgi:hypothetical protein
MVFGGGFGKRLVLLKSISLRFSAASSDIEVELFRCAALP